MKAFNDNLKENKIRSNRKQNIQSILTLIGSLVFALLMALGCKGFFGAEEELILDKEDGIYYSGKYDEALKEYEKKQKREKWPIWIIKEAEIYSLKEERAQSNSLLDKAYRDRNKLEKDKGIDKYKEEDKVLGNYITFTYLMNGDAEKARQYGEDFLMKEQNNNPLRETMTVVYLAQNNKDKAKEMVNGYKADDSFELAKKADLNMIVNNYEEGYKNLQESYNLNKNDIKILDVIENNVYGNREGAIEYLEELYKENSSNTITKLALAKTYSIEEKNLNKSLEILDTLSDEEKDSLLYNCIQLEINKKQVKDCTEIIDKIITKYEDTYGANYIAGMYYLENKDYKKASDYAIKSSFINKEYSNIYGLLLSNLMQNEGDENITKAYLRRGLYYSPSNCLIIENMANFYEKVEQKIDLAYDYYRLVSYVDAGRIENYYHMASIDIIKNELDKAIDSLETAVKINKSNDKYFATLGYLYFKEGDIDKGIENTRKAYEINERNIEALNNAAIYYAVYEDNIERAYKNIATANELVSESDDFIKKEIVDKNYNKFKIGYEQFEDDRYRKIDSSQVELIY
ncbi:hypothetical protein [Clostridium sardiniense]|uniref:hypothetical protein n=1 Tax=Clostridium sardiniense TaxID=29369 RepID=UPI003D356A51